MHKTILSLATLAAVSGCAYAVDTSVQDITLRTPGANNAVCYMYIDKVKYRVHPPQTISAFRTEEDLIIDCLAPGNRRKKVVIEPLIADSTYGNVITAGAGAAWDYASGAMFKYPDVVEISFIGVEEGPALIPDQNNPDIRQPEEYELEEFRPSQPRMNSDKYAVPTQILKRQSGTMTSSAISDTEAFTENSNASMGKGDLQAVVDSYAGALDPSVSTDGPTPIIPGE